MQTTNPRISDSDKRVAGQFIAENTAATKLIKYLTIRQQFVGNASVVAWFFFRTRRYGKSCHIAFCQLYPHFPVGKVLNMFGRIGYVFRPLAQCLNQLLKNYRGTTSKECRLLKPESHSNGASVWGASQLQSLGIIFCVESTGSIVCPEAATPKEAEKLHGEEEKPWYYI